jgi:hypothetical protein
MVSRSEAGGSRGANVGTRTTRGLLSHSASDNFLRKMAELDRSVSVLPGPQIRLKTCG